MERLAGIPESRLDRIGPDIDPIVGPGLARDDDPGHMPPARPGVGDQRSGIPILDHHLHDIDATQLIGFAL